MTALGSTPVRNILVIGGSGFIGTRLIDVLVAEGYEVANLDLAPSPRHAPLTTLGDVCNLAAVTAASAGRDVIVNLAAEHRDDVRPVSRYDSVNVDGARTVAAAAEANGIDRIVFTSTVAVYGLDQPDPDETAPPVPFNDYGRTKLAAEQILCAWAEQDDRRSLVVVRPAVVFGEGNRGNVYNLARQVASGRFLFVGDGSNRKSMGYVGNLAAYLAGSVTAGPGTSVVNYADKPDLTTRQIVELIHATLGSARRSSRTVPLPLGLAAGRAFDGLSRVSGRSLPVSSVRIRKFTAQTTVDTTRLQASGFQAEVTVPEALRRTLLAEFGDRARVTS